MSKTYYDFKIIMDDHGNKWMSCSDCNTEINMEIFMSQDKKWRKEFLTWHYEVECIQK